VAPERIQARIAKLDEQIAKAKPYNRVKLLQQRIDLEKALKSSESSTPSARLDDLEDEFRNVAWSYSQAHGLTYEAWRRLGVPGRVLQAAGIRPTRKVRSA